MNWHPSINLASFFKSASCASGCNIELYSLCTSNIILKTSSSCIWSWLLHYWLHCSCFILFPSVHTSLFMFHLISFSPHFIVHVPSHFLQSTLHWSCIIFISFRPQSISLILIHIKCTFDVIVSFTFQPIPSLEINNLRMFLDKLLISNIYSLHEAEL